MGRSSGLESGRNPGANITHDLGPYGATVRRGKARYWVPTAACPGSAVNQAASFKGAGMGEIPASWEVTHWRSFSPRR